LFLFNNEWLFSFFKYNKALPIHLAINAKLMAKNPIKIGFFAIAENFALKKYEI